MASRRRVSWTRQGQQTLEEVVSYLAEEAPAAARRLLSEALETASSLSTLGERGRVVPEFGNAQIRALFVYRYRLIYRVAEGEVFILALIHGARAISPECATSTIREAGGRGSSSGANTEVLVQSVVTVVVEPVM